jgi:hypothetical protein
MLPARNRWSASPDRTEAPGIPSRASFRLSEEWAHAWTWLLRASGKRPSRSAAKEYDVPGPASLRSVIGFLAIENAFESAKVPFRRSRSVVQTGAPDILLGFFYYGLG